MKDQTPLFFAFVVLGSFFSFGRESLSGYFAKVHARLTKREESPRLKKGVQLYLMLTGMIFTLFGVLGLLKLMSW